MNVARSIINGSTNWLQISWTYRVKHIYSSGYVLTWCVSVVRVWVFDAQWEFLVKRVCCSSFLSAATIKITLCSLYYWSRCSTDRRQMNVLQLGSAIVSNPTLPDYHSSNWWVHIDVSRSVDFVYFSYTESPSPVSLNCNSFANSELAVLET